MIGPWTPRWVGHRVVVKGKWTAVIYLQHFSPWTHKACYNSHTHQRATTHGLFYSRTLQHVARRSRGIEPPTLWLVDKPLYFYTTYCKKPPEWTVVWLWFTLRSSPAPLISLTFDVDCRQFCQPSVSDSGILTKEVLDVSLIIFRVVAPCVCFVR